MLRREHVESAYAALRTCQVNHVEHALAWLTQFVVAINAYLEDMVTTRAVGVYAVVAEHAFFC